MLAHMFVFVFDCFRLRFNIVYIVMELEKSILVHPLAAPVLLCSARPPTACHNRCTGSAIYAPMPLPRCEGDACTSRALPVASASPDLLGVSLWRERFCDSVLFSVVAL